MPKASKNPASPVVLIIRDGWGKNPNTPEIIEKQRSAIALAHTPTHDRLAQSNPQSLLHCSGEEVGLPAGQMGNSEVGHLNIGAGRIVYQDFVRINRAIDNGEFFHNPTLLSILREVKATGSTLHLIGLCSDGGVHSHLNHLYALLDMAASEDLDRVNLHCLTDGRDTSPTSGAGYVREVVEQCVRIGVGRVASVTGRYYAMDRDNRWDRVKTAYDALVHGKAIKKADPVKAIEDLYAEDTTDEFLPPTLIIEGPDSPAPFIRDGDGVVFFNFRADRARELERALVDPKFSEFERPAPPKIGLVCMTEHDPTLNLPIAFEPEVLSNILAHVLSEAGISQYRISETEKYPHVTYFFNGGVEPPVKGEERFLVPSPKVATYDLLPEMSAPAITKQLIKELKGETFGFHVVNFANGDMVGHTGSVAAAIKAVETVDKSVGEVLDVVTSLGGVALLTSDHGNAERMVDDDGSPFTAHTTYPVDITYVGENEGAVQLNDGNLADVAPTVLDLLQLPKPPEMTGRSLIL